MRRGYSLVEVMITVAILGILAAGPASLARRNRLQGLAELHRAQALLVLEYQGQAAATGRAVDPAVLTRLTSGLPGASVSEELSSTTTTFTVRWRDPLGTRAARSLTVFVR